MSKNVKMSNPMKVITGPDTRWSYANVWEPKSINGGAPKYSVSLIIPKSDTKTVARVKAAIEAAYHEGESKLKGNGKSVPALSVIKTPLRDGDLERPDDAAYANAYFINANATSAPGIVDADLNPIMTRSEVYSGVYGRASITFYAFNSSGNKGIACGLNNLQKVRDGQPLGGKASASPALRQRPTGSAPETVPSTLPTNGPPSSAITSVMSRPRWASSRSCASSRCQTRSGRSTTSTKR